MIGLATLETPTTTAGFEKKLFPAYKFLQYKDIVISEASKLRKKGANAVILVGHVGNQCSNDFTYGIWKKNTQQNPNTIRSPAVSWQVGPGQQKTKQRFAIDDFPGIDT